MVLAWCEREKSAESPSRALVKPERKKIKCEITKAITELPVTSLITSKFTFDAKKRLLLYMSCGMAFVKAFVYLYYLTVKGYMFLLMNRWQCSKIQLMELISPLHAVILILCKNSTTANCAFGRVCGTGHFWYKNPSPISQSSEVWVKGSGNRPVTLPGLNLVSHSRSSALWKFCSHHLTQCSQRQ